MSEFRQVIAVVEGKCEQEFVAHILAPYLRNFCIFVRPIQIAKPGLPGGIRPWVAVKPQLEAVLKSDRRHIVTTLVDYYGLPMDWPGRSQAKLLPKGYAPSARATLIEQAIMSEFSEYGPRFVPFVMMHEFEALLYAQPEILGQSIGHSGLERMMVSATATDEPEAINDSPITAPSKRILGVYPGYRKVLHGGGALQRIPLSTLRSKCPHFNDWVVHLESFSMPMWKAE